MGKSSKASRRKDNTRLRQRRRLEKFSNTNQIKKKEEEIADLQVEIQRLNKFIEEAKEKVIDKLTQSNHEQNNLLKWIDLFTEQIKNQEKEIYSLNLKLYSTNI